MWTPLPERGMSSFSPLYTCVILCLFWWLQSCSCFVLLILMPAWCCFCLFVQGLKPKSNKFVSRLSFWTIKAYHQMAPNTQNGQYERLAPAAGPSCERVGEREIKLTNEHASTISLSYLALSSHLYRHALLKSFPGTFCVFTWGWVKFEALTL